MARCRVQTLIATLLWAALWGTAVYGCGDDFLGGKSTTPPSPPTSIDLTVINRSMLELLEIRIHGGLDYRNADNLLLQPLADDAEVTFFAIPNNRYITVIRRRVENGMRIAFTTAYALQMTTNRQQLYVFQQSFRLEALDNVYPPEGGPMDGGGSDGGTPGDP